jgi:antitoxin (DNA-binding transcriptional repressor) of toxin-antitoxin stability system
MAMEPRRISRQQLVDDLDAILDDVEAGVEFVVVDESGESARLVPVDQPIGPRTFVPYDDAVRVVMRAREAFRGVSMRDIRDAVDNEPRY